MRLDALAVAALIAGALGSWLGAACGGRLDEGPEPGDAATLEAGPSPFDVACGTPCPATYYSVEWLAPDGGADHCECVPQSQGSCSSLDGPTPPDCSCTVCAGNTSACTFDPYYGTIATVRCNE
jgi:hypothetical protein